jgi:uncharacterized membrane-anchored protein
MQLPEPSVATSTGIGFERGALVFAGLIELVAAAHFFTSLPKSILFWAAYILTRHLGATLGDTLTKQHTEGGLALARFTSSLMIAAAMVILIALMSRRERFQAV